MGGRGLNLLHSINAVSCSHDWRRMCHFRKWQLLFAIVDFGSAIVDFGPSSTLVVTYIYMLYSILVYAGEGQNNNNTSVGIGCWLADCRRVEGPTGCGYVASATVTAARLRVYLLTYLCRNYISLAFVCVVWSYTNNLCATTGIWQLCVQCATANRHRLSTGTGSWQARALTDSSLVTAHAGFCLFVVLHNRLWIRCVPGLIFSI